MRVYPKFCLFGNNLTKPYNHAYALSLKFVRVTHGDYLVHSGYLANQFPKTIQYHIPLCLHFQVQKFKQPFIANRKKRGTRFIHVSKSKNDLRERERERERESCVLRKEMKLPSYLDKYINQVVSKARISNKWL